MVSGTCSPSASDVGGDMSYTYDDIVRSLRALGLEAGQTVYVIAALWKVPGLEGCSQQDIPRFFYEAVREVLGSEGTLVVGTHSLNLCNTDTPFDPESTPSYERGMLPEYVRTLPGARRSFHPFVSYAAIGPRAGFIVDRVSRHGYGPETPEGRLIELDARSLSIGMQPRILTTVHQVEHCMCVPYRYCKEFMHPVVREGEVRVEPFYLHVRYRDIGLYSLRNTRLFELLQGRLEIVESPLGRGRLFAYRTRDFFNAACRIMAEDIYVWCEHPPDIRPYQQ